MVNLALIGAGRWGQNFLKIVNSLNICRIKAVCTQSQKSLDSLSNKYIKTTSLEDLLNINLDGIIIATPAETHFEIAKLFLKQGFNLLIEKPLTTNYSEALELQKIWRRKKPKVLVGHTYLYNPAYSVFKKLFKNIKSVRSISFEGLVSPIRKNISVIWDWGPHPISILKDLIKQPISKVNANGLTSNPNNKLYDTVKASIQFSDGLTASIHISWFGDSKVRKLTVEGEKETIQLNETNTNHQKILLSKLNTPPQYPTYKSEIPLTQELREFVAAIHGVKKITSDISMGVEIVKVLSAIEQSVENNGQSIPLQRI